jgi:hypothetical protein
MGKLEDWYWKKGRTTLDGSSFLKLTEKLPPGAVAEEHGLIADSTRLTMPIKD